MPLSATAQELYILADGPFSYSFREGEKEQILTLYGLSQVLPPVFAQLQKMGLAYKVDGEKFLLRLPALKIEIKRLKPYLIKVKFRP